MQTYNSLKPLNVKVKPEDNSISIETESENGIFYLYLLPHVNWREIISCYLNTLLN